jgi:TolA-binding protein
MQIARAYKLAGKVEDAKKTFNRVASEFPQSPYAAAARREAEGSGA